MTDQPLEPGPSRDVPSLDVGARWQLEQVLALAPRASSIAAAEALALPARWVGLGCDQRAVWGRCAGTGGEPYECMVDHLEVAVRCTCKSRVVPCKHTLALLLLWARGLVPHVPTAAVPAGVVDWATARTPSPAPSPNAPAPNGLAPNAPAPNGLAPNTPSTSAPVPNAPARDEPLDLRGQRDDRVARMAAGLADLDRWIDDRLRTGLADASLSRYDTWDGLAARLVDAQVGGLANRVRRLAGIVGVEPQWHQLVLAELGMLHLLAQAGRRLGTMPPALADSVAATIGWQVRQADVLAGVPHTDRWVVLGRSDTREDRIEVRRVWMYGRDTGRWAMVLSFAAYGQSLDDSLEVGHEVVADLFRYPGALGVRALVGARHQPPMPVDAVSAVPVARTMADACATVGRAIAAEPWIERVPLWVEAAPARHRGQWVLTDHTGSLPLADGSGAVGTLLACSGGHPVLVVAEWTSGGLVPLAVHLADRSIDIGPRADASFLASVGA